MAKRKPSPKSISVDVVRWGSIAVICLITLFLAYMALSAFLRHARLFVVRDIFVEESAGEIKLPELDKLKGKNIFAVDLSSVEGKVRAKYPQVGDLKVLKRYPDQIYIRGFRRQALASVLAGGRTFDASMDGFYMRHGDAGETRLPLIRGVKAKAAPGERITDENALAGLKVVEFIRSSQPLMDLGFEYVDVSDLLKIRCDFDSDAADFDIFIEKARLDEQLRTFAAIIGRRDLDLKEISYIDLRFGEPVIGRKKTKK